MKMQGHNLLLFLMATLLFWWPSQALFSRAQPDEPTVCREQLLSDSTVSVTSDERDGISYVRFQTAEGIKTVTLSGVGRVQAVCSLANNTVVIIGVLAGMSPAGYEVAVANSRKRRLIGLMGRVHAGYVSRSWMVHLT